MTFSKTSIMFGFRPLKYSMWHKINILGQKLLIIGLFIVKIVFSTRASRSISLKVVVVLVLVLVVDLVVTFCKHVTMSPT